MKINLRSSIFVSIAIACGLIVLLGYFFPIFIGLREAFLEWAVILSAVLLFIGVFHLARVHKNKVMGNQPGRFYSVALLVSLALTLIVVMVGTWIGDIRIFRWFFNYIQLPIETSLLAILTVVLALAVVRILNRRMNVFTSIFVITLFIVFLGTISIPGLETNPVTGLRNWISQVLAVAGARGILLGIALGTIATGLRVMIGTDRPYGG